MPPPATESAHRTSPIANRQSPTCPYSEADWRIVRAFTRLIDQRGLNRHEAGQLIGVSAGAVSTLLKGTYKAQTWPRHLAAMRQAIQRDVLSRYHVPDPPFVPLAASTLILNTLALCRDCHLLGFVQGMTGTGKTRAIDHYTAENRDAIALVCAPGTGARSLLVALARRLHAEPENDKSTPVYFESVAAALRERGSPLVILDEIDHGARLEQIGYRLYDDSGSGMVWIGTAEFLEAMTRRRRGTSGQALRRINPCRSLAAKRLRFTLDEAEQLADAWRATVPEIRLDGDRLAIAHELSCHNLGRFVEGVKAAVRGARISRGPLDAGRLRAGFAELMSYERYAG